MKRNRKTDIAIRLIAQAYVLDRMGAQGLDCKALAALLREAAKSLDATAAKVSLP